jgi:Holliday junction resolvasome RuvABC endonuclease subunit
MKLPVLGMDPSLRHWGLAESVLDMDTGYLDTPRLSIIEPNDPKGKQVRQNSTDLAIAEQLALGVLAAARKAMLVFVEVPVGSQSARAMASYGVCVGILGTIRAEGIQLIEVSPTEVKKAFTGNKTATKEQMIAEALKLYPKANFPQHRGKLTAKAEHVADAIATIHAGVLTPLFLNIMRINQQV